MKRGRLSLSLSHLREKLISNSTALFHGHLGLCLLQNVINVHFLQGLVTHSLSSSLPKQLSCSKLQNGTQLFLVKWNVGPILYT